MLSRWHWAAAGLVALAAGLALWGWSTIGISTGEADTPPVWPLPESPLQARKARLINTLLPAIRENNRHIAEQRYRVRILQEQLKRGRALPERDRAWLGRLARQYRLPEPDAVDLEWITTLLRRLDVVPADLALAQGAIESAWGTSRFALKGNNYFGHWCFEKGCGLVPRRRSAGAAHEVRVFETPDESVRLYMRNLNSHPGYTRLRLIREELRAEGEPLNGEALAAGLGSYSALGDEYNRRLRALIRRNDLHLYLKEW